MTNLFSIYTINVHLHRTNIRVVLIHRLSPLSIFLDWYVMSYWEEVSLILLDMRYQSRHVDTHVVSGLNGDVRFVIAWKLTFVNICNL